MNILILLVLLGTDPRTAEVNPPKPDRFRCPEPIHTPLLSPSRLIPETDSDLYITRGAVFRVSRIDAMYLGNGVNNAVIVVSGHALNIPREDYHNILRMMRQGR